MALPQLMLLHTAALLAPYNTLQLLVLMFLLLLTSCLNLCMLLPPSIFKPSNMSFGISKAFFIIVYFSNGILLLISRPSLIWTGVVLVMMVVSTTTYVLYLGSNIIFWKSSRQKSISQSSTEAEYKALAHAAIEVIQVQHLLQDLGVSLSSPPHLFCDDIGATYFYANPIYRSRMKHLALDYHFVRERVATSSLHILHISSKDQFVDMLTKALDCQQNQQT